MKRTKYNVIISILLVLASLAAIAAGGWGLLECYALNEMKEKLPETAEKVDKLIEAIDLLDEYDDEYTDGVEQVYKGDAQLLQGRQQVNAGKYEFNKGKKVLEEAQAQYDAAVIQLNDGKAQLAQAQQQMEAARPEYEEGKAQLERLELLQPMLHTYVSFKNGTLEKLNGFNSLNAWYKAVVIPYAATQGINLPSDMDKFSESMDQQIAEGQAMMAEYEAAEAELKEAQAVIDDADAQLAEAKTLLAGKYSEMNEADSIIKNAEGQLNYATSQLEEGKASLAEFEDAVGKTEEATGKILQTEPVCHRDGSVAVEGVAARLGEGFDIYKYNDAGELLALSNGEPRIDYAKCRQVCDAYLEYTEDYAEDIGSEINVRMVLDIALIAAGIFAFISAIKALRGKRRAVAMSKILLAYLVLCNIAGLVVGYANFAHPQGEDAYQGLITCAGMLLLTLISVLFMFACIKGGKNYVPAENVKVKKIENKTKAAKAPAAPKPAEAPAEKPRELSEYEKAKLEYEKAFSRYNAMRNKTDSDK